MGCAVNPIIQTPNVDRLAGAGVRFEQAFVTTPICAASRASILTGTFDMNRTRWAWRFDSPEKYQAMVKG